MQEFATSRDDDSTPGKHRNITVIVDDDLATQPRLHTGTVSILVQFFPLIILFTGSIEVQKGSPALYALLAVNIEKRSTINLGREK